MIKVSCASSLFQEKWLDPKGIFTLLLNAVDRDISYRNSTFIGNDLSDDAGSVRYLLFLEAASSWRIQAIGLILNAENSFRGDLDEAQKRIEQFARDHERIKQIEDEQQKFSFWEMFFSRRKEYVRLYREKAKLEGMMIYVSTLMEVAFYRYNQVTQRDKFEFIAELKEFLENERERDK